METKKIIKKNRLEEEKSSLYFKKSLKDGMGSVFLAISTLFGTEKKVKNLNQKSIERVREKHEELTILLHGYMANYYMAMYSPIRWFNKREINIVSIGYDYREPIEKSSLKVKAQIEDVMKRAKVKKINIIGISLGGVMARYYAEELGGKKVIDKLVTIYTPLKPVPEKDLSYKFHLLLGNNPHFANEGIKKIEGLCTVKNHLAVYGVNDKIIRLECTTTDKVPQIGIEGGHTFVSYNPVALDVTLAYLKKGSSMEVVTGPQERKKKDLKKLTR